MARPRKKPEDQRSRVLSVRFTADEYARVEKMARAAGMLPGPYARATILDKRPRSKPANIQLFRDLLYELQSIATNFNQLEGATGEAVYLDWARYVGGQLVEQLIGRNDLADLIEQQLPIINDAGQVVNGLARQANSGKPIQAAERDEAFGTVRHALEPIQNALEKSPTKPASQKDSPPSK